MIKMVTKQEVQANNPDRVIADEIFKPINLCGCPYMISNYGNVVALWGSKSGKYLTLQPVTSKDNTYIRVGVRTDHKQKMFLVHVLVATAFIPNPEGKPTVNHIDGCKCNNYVGNLEWATHTEQIQHAYDTGLAKGKITFTKPVVVLETGEMYESAIACDRANKYPDGYVSRVIRDIGGFASTVNLHFRYASIDEYAKWQNERQVITPTEFGAEEYLNRGMKHNSKCVRIVETGECFSSGAECDRAYGLVNGATSDVLKRDDKYYGKMDWHIERISKEEYLAWKADPVVKEHKPNLAAQTNLKLCRGGYCVKILETGECFKTAKECDKLKGFPRDFTSITISKYGGHRKRASSYHFVKITLDEYIAYVQSQSNI